MLQVASLRGRCRDTLGRWARLCVRSPAAHVPFCLPDSSSTIAQLHKSLAVGTDLCKWVQCSAFVRGAWTVLGGAVATVTVSFAVQL